MMHKRCDAAFIVVGTAKKPPSKKGGFVDNDVS